MRLLDTSRLELVEVAEANAPEYAILSHTWGREEVSFQEFQYISRRWPTAVSQTASSIKARSGYTKIKRAAALAAGHGFGFIWIDTCCIDKTSSAELSEAINSMYRWYEKAVICYAYLDDVKHGYHDVKGGVFHYLCQHSRWFTRGWTLQELIAPDDVMFYGADWGFLGSKGNDEDVRISLSGITGIDMRVLEGLITPYDMSIAARMKWASQRKTTRVEDMAYSLMGIFDVNMPLLYGEGNKAFIRLQEEILKSSDDQTIFAWASTGTDITHAQLCGLLAEEPIAFANTNNYRPLPPAIVGGSTAWATTNHGLRVALILQPVTSDNGSEAEDEYNAVLECAKRRGDGWSESPAIRVRRLYGDQFARVNPQILEVVATSSYDQDPQSGSYEVIFVKQKPVYTVPDFMVSFTNIRQSAASEPTVYVTGVWPEKYWDVETATLRSIPSNTDRIAGLLRFHAPELGTEIDCAIGLHRSPGGAWNFSTMQRTSDGSSLHKAAASANLFITQKQKQNITDTSPLNKQPKSSSWRLEGANLINVHIHDTYIHGRRYFFVKASPATELPVPTALPPTEPPSPTEDHLLPLDFRLKNLLMDVTVSTSLKCGYFASEPPPLSRVRTAPLVPIPEEFENMIRDRPLNGSDTQATQVLRASKKGNVAKLIKLDDRAPWSEVVTKDFFDFGPLHWAVLGGHLPVVKTLLRLGADLRSRTTQGWLPFHLAALFGRFTVMNWLLDEVVRKGLPPWTEKVILEDQRNVLRENPIHIAVGYVSTAVGEELEALYRLLHRAQTTNAWVSTNYLGETPLHRLAAVGEIHLQSDWRMMSFFKSVFIKELFLREGLKWEFLDKNGRSLLWHAVCGRSSEKVEWLIKYDRDGLSVPDVYGMTPLHIACRQGNASVARILLLAGADPNAKTKSPGLTALQYAIIFNQPECVRLLLEHGADATWSTRNEKESFMPIQLGLSEGYRECVRTLNAFGVERCWTCTHYLRRIPSNNDLCPFELIKKDTATADVLGDRIKKPVRGGKTILSIQDPNIQDIFADLRLPPQHEVPKQTPKDESEPGRPDPLAIPLPESPKPDVDDALNLQTPLELEGEVDVLVDGPPRDAETEALASRD